MGQLIHPAIRREAKSQIPISHHLQGGGKNQIFWGANDFYLAKAGKMC